MLKAAELPRFSQIQVAMMLGLKPSSVSGMFPERLNRGAGQNGDRNVHGNCYTFDPGDVHRWIVADLKEKHEAKLKLMRDKAAGVDDDLIYRKKLAECERIELQTEMISLKIARMSGKLMEVDVVHRIGPTIQVAVQAQRLSSEPPERIPTSKPPRP